MSDKSIAPILPTQWVYQPFGPGFVRAGGAAPARLDSLSLEPGLHAIVDVSIVVLRTPDAHLASEASTASMDILLESVDGDLGAAMAELEAAARKLRFGSSRHAFDFELKEMQNREGGLERSQRQVQQATAGWRAMAQGVQKLATSAKVIVEALRTARIDVAARNLQPQSIAVSDKRPGRRTTASTSTIEMESVLADLKRRLEVLPSRERLTDADAEGLYTLAYREYEQAHYQQSLHFFQALLVYRPTDTVYLLGAALCLRGLQQYELALGIYGALHFLQPIEPRHTLAIAKCHLMRGNSACASAALAEFFDFCSFCFCDSKVLGQAKAMIDMISAHNEPVEA